MQPVTESSGRGAGIAMGLTAALLFGAGVPLAKRFLVEAGPFVLAGLFYLAGAGAISLVRALRRGVAEAPLRRADLPALAGVVLLGGTAGPVLLMYGLGRTSGITGSLLMNLEAPLTMVLAVTVFREHLGPLERLAAVAIVGAAAALRIDPQEGRASWVGIAAISAACLCWAVDNNLTQRLSVRDAVAVAHVKTLVAGATNLVLGLVAGDRWPARAHVPWIVLVGAASYGASIVLDNLALRRLGAAREAAIFATAPFLAALLSVPILGERPSVTVLGAGLVMSGGVALLIRARHAHRHVHGLVEHEHVHVHDDHHRHDHASGAPPGEPHVHAHVHDALEHEHAHVSDVHHRHRH